MAKLYFFYSAMNAGKSTHLLQSAHNYEQRGMRPLLFLPAIDGREGRGIISSRIGLSRDAVSIGAEADLYALVGADRAAAPLDAVFVDEAQFLTPKQVLQLTLVVDKYNLPVMTYGLRTDFRGEPFEGSKYLLAWAEELVEIKTVCASGRKATMSARFQDGERIYEGEQIEIGYHYMPMSRQIFELERVSPIGSASSEASAEPSHSQLFTSSTSE